MASSTPGCGHWVWGARPGPSLGVQAEQVRGPGVTRESWRWPFLVRELPGGVKQHRFLAEPAPHWRRALGRPQGAAPVP